MTNIKSENPVVNAQSFAERIICDFNLNGMVNDEKVLDAIRQELIVKYLKCESRLDRKFIQDVLSPENQTSSRLW